MIRLAENAVAMGDVAGPSATPSPSGKPVPGDASRTRGWIRPVPAALERSAGWSWRLLVCAAAVFGVLALLWYLKVIVLPTVVALTLAPALTPLVGFLRRRLGLRRPAAALALVAGLAVVVGLLALVSTSIASQYGELADAVGRGVQDITNWLEGEPFNLSVDRADNLDSYLGDAWNQASGHLVSGLSTGVAFVTGIILAVALLYFVLRDGRELWRSILGRMSASRAPAVERAGERAWDVLSGYIRGTALIAAIDATLIGIGLWLLGVPLVIPLSILIFLGSFIPFVGATISGLIAVLVALADEGWEIALIALAVVIGVQFIEGNFFQPIIQSRTVDLHPAVILLAVAAGGSLYGILGAYLAVPITAVAFAIAAAFAEEQAVPAPAGRSDDP
jgi:predicted PurR-regulated permease PerM